MSDPISSNTTKPNGITTFLRTILGKDSDSGIKNSLEDLLEENDGRVAPLTADERSLISNILQSSDKTVKDLMVQRPQISAIDVDMKLRDSVETMVNNPHSRYPVYKNTLDNIIGMVHIKDVLSALVEKNKISLMKLIRPMLVVVPSMPMLDLLLQMRIERRHIAIVVDEFGGVDGLVTIEDAVEEIVGDIRDEHDIDVVDYCVSDGSGGYIIDARYTLEELSEKIGSFLTAQELNEDIDTVGGLIVHLLGRVPSRGEVVTHDSSGYEFIIKKSNPRRVITAQLRVDNKSKQP